MLHCEPRPVVTHAPNTAFESMRITKGIEMKQTCVRVTALAAAVSLGLLAQSVQAQDSFIPVPEDINVIGLGVGVAPDYEGSDDYQGAIGPAFFYNFKGSERWIQLLGPELTVNLLNNPTWAFGPMINYRFARDDDVDDSQVSKMDEIDGAVELGVFLRWRHVDPNNFRNRESARIYITQDVSDAHDDYVGGVSAAMFRQVSRAVDLMGGIGATVAGDDYFDTYFGVDDEDSARSGLPTFSADGGAKDVRATVGAIVHFGLKWHLGLGVQYRKLLGDASDSPVVDEAGDDNQWIGGAAIAYAWGK